MPGGVNEPCRMECEVSERTKHASFPFHCLLSFFIPLHRLHSNTAHSIFLSGVFIGILFIFGLLIFEAVFISYVFSILLLYGNNLFVLIVYFQGVICVELNEMKWKKDK